MEPRLPLQMPEQLPTALKIRHEIKIRLRLKTKFEPDQKRAVQRALEDLALADGVSDFFFGDDLALGEHFHGVDAVRVFFADLEDFAECASADEFEKFKVAGC
jgi:hypothetical protein